jgi:SAM-dependent methyltransferase
MWAQEPVAGNLFATSIATMSNSVAARFDEVPFEGWCYAHTHPDHLATLAFLMGLTPPPVERCRVLELGCGMGSNLAALAATLPESNFVGFDLSPRHIAAARLLARNLHLKNIHLEVRSILDVADSVGVFDYVICQGVYSWVVPEVQDKILEVCKNNLAPNGVAHVSYNTYPGWHLRYIARELMLFHTRPFEDSADKVREGRAILADLVKTVPLDTLYQLLLKNEERQIQTASDWYVFHEHLEPSNLACYFEEFMGRAAAKGLQYVGDSGWQTSVFGFPAELREKIERLAPERVRLEQYVDFLTNRTGRCTVLCHAEVPLAPRPLAQRLMKCGLTARVASSDGTNDAGSMTPAQGQAGNPAANVPEDPIVQAALLTLEEAWPRTLPFDELWDLVCAKLPEPPPRIMRPALAMTLLLHWQSNALNVRLSQRPICLTVGERPVAFAVARLQARAGAKAVCNLRNGMVQLDDINRRLVQLMTGEHSLATLHRKVGKPKDFEARLQSLARQALLTS